MRPAGPGCPHCPAPELLWLTRSEFEARVQRYRLKIPPDQWAQVSGPIPPDAPDFHYWLCLDCDLGGTLIF